MAEQTSLHTCWVGNITNELSREDLEKEFYSLSQNILGDSDRLHSVRVQFSGKRLSHFCFINCFKMEDAEKLVESIKDFQHHGKKLMTSLQNQIKQIPITAQNNEITNTKPTKTTKKFHAPQKYNPQTSFINNMDNKKKRGSPEDARRQSSDRNNMSISSKQNEKENTQNIYPTKYGSHHSSNKDGRKTNEKHCSTHPKSKGMVPSVNSSTKNSEINSDVFGSQQKPKDQQTRKNNCETQRESDSDSNEGNYNEDDDDIDSLNSSTSSDQDSVSSLAPDYGDIYRKTAVISCSKYLKISIEKRIKALKQKYNGINIDLLDGKKKGKIDLLAKISGRDRNLCEKIFKEIKSWKVFTKQLRLKEDEISQVKSKYDELKKQIKFKKLNKKIVFKDFNFNINEKRKQINIYCLDKAISNQLYDEIKRFCDKIIIAKQQIEIQDDDEFKFVNDMFKYHKTQLIAKFNLEKVGIEFLDPVKHKNLSGKIRLMAKRNILESLNINAIGGTHSKTINVPVKKNIQPYLKRRLKTMKKECDQKLMLLDYDDIERIKLFGFNEDEVKEVVKEVKDLLKNAKTTSISVEEKNLANAKKIIEEYNKERSQSNIDDDEENDIEVNFIEKNKIIYINGNDENEINQVKEFLNQKIKGSEECCQTMKISKNLIYLKLIKDQNKRLDSIKSAYNKVEIFSKQNKERIIRLTGDKNSVIKAKKEIEQLIADISQHIHSLPFEINKSELAYLQTMKNEIDNIKKQNDIFINMQTFELCATLKLRDNCEISLIIGDMTELNVDAYISPVNVTMDANGGLAKAIQDRAGEKIKRQCREYISKNGQMREGDVYVTNSGMLGVKDDCFIIHAAGPVWKGGQFNEAQNLSKVIESSLNETVERNCYSIAIPAVSTGIFNYDIDQATKIITETTIKFIKNQYYIPLKTIFFISNDENTVSKWEKNVKQLGVLNGLDVKSTNATQITKQWYWKDDEGKWKAYVSKYNEIIQSKYENNELKFQMRLDNNKTYDFYLQKPNLFNSNSFAQVNTETHYIHEISNEIPIISDHQWCWLDDKNIRSPYSIDHSNAIEKAFNNNKESVLINTKRHVDDKDEFYEIIFRLKSSTAKEYCKSRDPTADGIQINKRTSYQRLVYRQTTNRQADIENSEEETDCSRSKLLLISGYDLDITKSIKSLKTLLNDGIITENIPLFDLTENDIDRYKHQYNIHIELNDQHIVLKGYKDDIFKVKSELLSVSIGSSQKIQYPKTWNNSKKTNENLQIFEVNKDTVEYIDIYKRIAQTIPNPDIVKIERIQNKHLWKQYMKSVECLKDKGVSENEQFLFHGTRQTNPELVYNGEFGFQMQHSAAGMWGRGIYFAVNASYSKSGYTYKNADGTVSMFYARVALGDSVQLPSNSSYVLPPEKPNQANKKYAVMRYDSIKGNTGGSDIYIVYENLRAYPDYLITFKN